MISWESLRTLRSPEKHSPRCTPEALARVILQEPAPKCQPVIIFPQKSVLIIESSKMQLFNIPANILGLFGGFLAATKQLVWVGMSVCNASLMARVARAAQLSLTFSNDSKRKKYIRKPCTNSQ